METNAMSLMPMLVMQAIYAVFVAQVARRMNRNVVLWVVLSLVPLIGTFFFIYVMWTTILHLLDAINALKARNGLD